MSFDQKSFDYKSMDTLRPMLAKRRLILHAATVEELVEMIRSQIPPETREIKAEITFTGTPIRQITKETPPIDLPMEYDPSKTLATWYGFGELVVDRYKQIALNVKADTIEEELRKMLFEFHEEIMALFEDYLWLMMSRADLFAVEQMNRLDPSYHFAAQWTPADDALLEELITDTRNYLTGWTTDIQESFAKTLRDNAGLPAAELGIKISETLNAKIHRGRMIAHSQLMKAFNHTALKRYDNAGFDAIWLTALDLKVCPICEAKHGHPISEVGIPPEDSHPDCRCVAVPRKRVELAPD